MAKMGKDNLVVSREKPQVSVGFLTEAEGLLLASPSSEPLVSTKGSALLSEKRYKSGDVYRSVNASLVSVNTNKDMSSPAGTFRLELVDEGRYKYKYGFSWEHILRPNTLVWIDLQRPGLPDVFNTNSSSTDPVIKDAGAPKRTMVGFVDTVSYTASMSTGKPQRRIVIQGRDAGKLLINAEIKNSTAISIISQNRGFYNIFNEDIPVGQQNVASILESYWNKKLFSSRSPGEAAALGDGIISMHFGPKENRISSKEIIRYYMSTPSDSIFMHFIAPESRFDGNYFNFLKSIIGVPFNEMFIDTRFDHQNVLRPEDRNESASSDIPDTWRNAICESHSPFFKTNVERDVSSPTSPVCSIQKKLASDLFPNGQDLYATMFVRTTPWPWRGDNYINTSFARDGAASAVSSELINRLTGGDFNVDSKDPDGMSRWRHLPQHKIDSSDIINYTRNRTDLDVFNWFWCKDMFLESLQEGVQGGQSFSNDIVTAMQLILNPPITYEGLIKRYGIKFLEVSIPFMDTDRLLKYAWRYTRRLADYYAFNFVFWSASITIKGNPNIHIGDRVFVEPDNREYYIEGVSHDFQVFGQFTTSLTLTRGTGGGEAFWGSDPSRPNNRFFSFDAEAETDVIDLDETVENNVGAVKAIDDIQKGMSQ